MAVGRVLVSAFLVLTIALLQQRAVLGNNQATSMPGSNESTDGNARTDWFFITVYGLAVLSAAVLTLSTAVAYGTSRGRNVLCYRAGSDFIYVKGAVPCSCLSIRQLNLSCLLLWIILFFFNLAAGFKPLFLVPFLAFCALHIGLTVFIHAQIERVQAAAAAEVLEAERRRRNARILAQLQGEDPDLAYARQQQQQHTLAPIPTLSAELVIVLQPDYDFSGDVSCHHVAYSGYSVHGDQRDTAGMPDSKSPSDNNKGSAQMSRRRSSYLSPLARNSPKALAPPAAAASVVPGNAQPGAGNGTSFGGIRNAPSTGQGGLPRGMAYALRFTTSLSKTSKELSAAAAATAEEAATALVTQQHDTDTTEAAAAAGNDDTHSIGNAVSLASPHRHTTRAGAGERSVAPDEVQPPGCVTQRLDGPSGGVGEHTRGVAGATVSSVAGSASGAGANSGSGGCSPESSICSHVAAPAASSSAIRHGRIISPFALVASPACLDLYPAPRESGDGSGSSGSDSCWHDALEGSAAAVSAQPAGGAGAAAAAAEAAEVAEACAGHVTVVVDRQ